MAYYMIPQIWVLYCLKIDKTPEQAVQFMEKTLETWKVELTAEVKGLTEVKIQRRIFQGEVLSLLIFLIAMRLLNHILRKSKTRHKLSKSQKKINDLMCHDDIKLFAKNEKRIVNSNTDCENIQLRYWNEI